MVVLVSAEIEAEGIGAVAAEMRNISATAVRLLEDISMEDLVIG